jgi:hypothetical protein
MSVVQDLPLGSNTPLAPTGTIDLWDNGQHLGGPFTLAQTGLFGNVGQASTTVQLAAGVHPLSLTYSGDSNYQAGSFLKHTFEVTVPSPTGALARVTLEQNPGTVTVGQAVNYTMTVRPTKTGGPVPTGTVTLVSVDGFTQSSPIPLVHGNATFTQLYNGSGIFLDNASYSGDHNYSPENSGNLLTTVTRLVPAVTLTAAASTLRSGERTSVSVSVIGQPNNPSLAIPAGLVRFYDSVNGEAEHPLGAAQYLTIGNGGNPIYTQPLDLTAGTHVIRAEYLGSNTSPFWGDPNDWAPASSNKVTVLVQ